MADDGEERDALGKLFFDLSENRRAGGGGWVRPVGGARALRGRGRRLRGPGAASQAPRARGQSAHCARAAGGRCAGRCAATGKVLRELDAGAESPRWPRGGREPRVAGVAHLVLRRPSDWSPVRRCSQSGMRASSLQPRSSSLRAVSFCIWEGREESELPPSSRISSLPAMLRLTLRQRCAWQLGNSARCEGIVRFGFAARFWRPCHIRDLR